METSDFTPDLELGDGPTDPRFRAAYDAARVPPAAPTVAAAAPEVAPLAATLPPILPPSPFGAIIAACVARMWLLWLGWGREAAAARAAAAVTTPIPFVPAADLAAERLRALEPAPAVAPAAAVYNPTAAIRLVTYDRDERGRPVGGRLGLVTPFPGRGMPRALRDLGGDWVTYGVCVPTGAAGVWHFPMAALPQVRRLVSQFFPGNDGGPLPPSVAALAAEPAWVPAMRAENDATVAVNVAARAAQAAAADARQQIPTVRDPAPVPPPAATTRAAARNRRDATPPPTSAAALASLDAALGGALTDVNRSEAESMRVSLRNGDLVAGARTDGQGVMLGWTGRRERTRAQLQAALARAGAPAEWAPPSKSAHAHAGAAIGKLSREGLIPRVARDLAQVDKRRGVSARWIVARALTEGQVGDAGAAIILTAELINGELRLDGDRELAREVHEEYTRLAAGDVYAAADVTGWLAGLLSHRLGAARLGQTWYVRAGNAELAERICTEIAGGDGTNLDKGWGTDWMLPALPVATSAQLRAGLARALITEARDVLDDLATQRKAATAAKRTEIGTRAAVTLLGKLRTVSERAAQFAVILGEDHLKGIRAEIAAAVAVVEPLCDDTSQRGAMLELD